MSINRIFRLSGLAAMASGVSALLAAFMVLAGVFVPVMPELPQVVLLLITDLLTIFALFGLYGCQYKGSGALGLTGVLFSMGGILLSFFVPLVGRLIFLVGMLLMALANARSKGMPTAGYWMWFTGALIGISSGVVGLRILLAFGLILSANGRMWLGAALWKLNAAAVRPHAA